ncbi:hypothetical protein C8J56DRAFT_1159756 [Mycena floridula]|nr:hypothetical protein C8J56DRAFT_1159756 [Mycena floridula]
MGIGTVSGRAVLGLGSLALQGFESRAIRNRLRVVKAMIPIPDDSPPSEADEALDDLLELSRLDLYSDKIKSKALTMLIQQLGSKQYRHLADRVSHQSHDEARHDFDVISERTVMCFPTVDISSRFTDMGDDRTIYATRWTSIYEKSISKDPSDENAGPLLDFLCLVARQNELGFETVIQMEFGGLQANLP